MYSLERYPTHSASRSLGTVDGISCGFLPSSPQMNVTDLQTYLPRYLGSCLVDGGAFHPGRMANGTSSKVIVYRIPITDVHRGEGETRGGQADELGLQFASVRQWTGGAAARGIDWATENCWCVVTGGETLGDGTFHQAGGCVRQGAARNSQAARTQNWLRAWLQGCLPRGPGRFEGSPLQPCCCPSTAGGVRRGGVGVLVGPALGIIPISRPARLVMVRRRRPTGRKNTAHGAAYPSAGLTPDVMRRGCGPRFARPRDHCIHCIHRTHRLPAHRQRVLSPSPAVECAGST
jgi:hypothetical protein